MLIDAPAWFSGENVDSPWQRLYWTLPLALLICASALFLFSDFMEHDAPTPPKPLPVDAQIIELPSPAAAHAAARSEPPPPPPPPVAKQPALAQPAPPPPAAHARPAPASPPKAAAPPAKAAPSQPPAPAIPNRGAQSVVHPMPAIPDDLREDAMNEVATARFHVAADGSTTVELVRPTQNPRLNRFLLDALVHWKFAPAIQDGRPVPSVEDIAIRISVE